LVDPPALASAADGNGLGRCFAFTLRIVCSFWISASAAMPRARFEVLTSLIIIIGVADFLSCQLFSNAFGGGSGDERRIPQSNQEPPPQQKHQNRRLPLEKKSSKKKGSRFCF
jgi:hypothetical protein